MIRKKILSLLAFVSFTGILQQTLSMDDQQKHIVIGMSHLMLPNKTAAVKKLGVKGAMQAAMSGSFDEQSTLEDLFDLISSLEFGQDETETVIWKGQQVPAPMIHWLKGKVACDHMLQQLKVVITKKCKLTTRMNRIAEMVFDPTTCLDVLTPNRDTFQLIYKLQKQGHVVHVLGNWHSDISSAIKRKHIGFFTPILKSGKVRVSGDLGEVKCAEHSEIYRKFVEEIAGPPAYAQCYFVEESTVEHDAIMSLDTNDPPTVLVAEQTDITSLATQLYEHGLLPEE